MALKTKKDFATQASNIFDAMTHSFNDKENLHKILKQCKETIIQLEKVRSKDKCFAIYINAAHFNPDAGGYYKRGRANFEKKMNSSPMYGRVEIVNIDSTLAESNSVDAVLTFRNLHNWLGPLLDTIFSNSYKALKPGGIFGVVEHRANEGTALEVMKKSGYVTEKHAIAMAKKHGFELVSKSEVNSNPKDIKNYPKGVWTLPPNLRMKDVDKEKYLEIGESDRMTLLFRKPL